MITPEQRQLRRHSIGSSEIGALLNVDPYQSAADVWLSKTGQTEDFEGNAATERGIALEPVLIAFAEKTLGRQFVRDRMLTHSSGLLHTNFDAIDGPGTESIEAKTTVAFEDWGEPGTDQVPDKVIAQAHHGFACVPTLQVCWVPVLLPGYRSLDFRLYEVRRNDLIVDAIVSTATEFMERFVRPRIRPTDYRPSIDVLKRVRREPQTVAQVPNTVAEKLIVARAARLQAEKDEQSAQAELLAAMGQAEAAQFDGGLITYLEVRRRGYTVEPSTYRKFGFPKAPKQIETQNTAQAERIAV